MWSIRKQNKKGIFIGTGAALFGAATAVVGTQTQKKKKLYSTETFMCDHTEVYSGGIRKRLWITSIDPSWIDLNPGWETHLLLTDEDYVTFIPDIVKEVTNHKKTIPYHVRREIYCINILQKYGGVWVGPALTLVDPLDVWISEYVQTPSNISFLTYQGHSGCAGIVAANQFCAMISVLKKEMNACWKNRVRSYDSRKGILEGRVKALCQHSEIFSKRWKHQLDLINFK